MKAAAALCPCYVSISTNASNSEEIQVLRSRKEAGRKAASWGRVEDGVLLVLEENKFGHPRQLLGAEETEKWLI